MQGLYIAILKSYPDSSFDDTDSTFEDFLASHNDLTFPSSFPYLEIFEIKEFTVLVCMDKDKRFSFMQKHIRYLISFLEFDRFDTSSGLTHRSEINALEEKHPSVFGQDTDIVRIIYCFDTQDFFFISKFHNDSREFLE
ncbi:MAG: hypothetical protein WCJ45_04650 [bacterium]